MLAFRDLILAALICLHVVGGAAAFRRLFPRESPWLGFFIPILAFVALLDFIEHGVALPTLYWLLPISTAGCVWVLARAGRAWKALRLPALVFLGAFAFTLTIRILQPDINFYCTEDLTDTNRILNFCLGDKLPPTDSWLPPFAHTGYYTFMHYGASVMKRLLDIDVGTACNLGASLVSALTLTGSAAAAYSLSRGRVVVTILIAAVVAGGFTGSSPSLTFFQPQNPEPSATIDLGAGGDDPTHAIFARFLNMDPPDTALRLYTPGCYIYYPEFHATMGGELVAVWTVFAVAELLRRKRSIFPWIFLFVAPVLAFITCSWFIFMVTILAGASLPFVWIVGRWPSRPLPAAMGAVLAAVLLWPALNDLTRGASRQTFYWSADLLRDFWTLVFQWWPIYLPWLVLCFTWRRLNISARWLHFLFVPVMVCTEAFFFTERGTMIEKTWGGAFAIGMAALYPMLLTQKNWPARLVAAAILLTSFGSLGAWSSGAYAYSKSTNDTFCLEGDHFLKDNPAMLRLEEMLGGRMRGQIVLTGIAHRAFFESTALPAFTENRCFLGWTNAEETCGHPAEADAREQQINDFYAGRTPDPLQFLRTNDIAAVVVWPDDKIPDAWVAAMKTALAPDFTYADCRGDSLNNAGLFLRNPVRAPSLQR